MRHKRLIWMGGTVVLAIVVGVICKNLIFNKSCPYSKRTPASPGQVLSTDLVWVASGDGDYGRPDNGSEVCRVHVVRQRLWIDFLCEKIQTSKTKSGGRGRLGENRRRSLS